MPKTAAQPRLLKLWFAPGQLLIIRKAEAVAIADGLSLEEWIVKCARDTVRETKGGRIVTGKQLNKILREKHQRILHHDQLYKLRMDRWTEGEHYFAVKEEGSKTTLSYRLDKVLPDILSTGMGKRKYAKSLLNVETSQKAAEEEESVDGNPVIRAYLG